MQLSQLFSIIEKVQDPNPHYPPTLIFNEGWLLRLVMDWFSKQKAFSHPLTFAENANWFSEAMLPTAFSARFRGDPLAESRTHLDGVIGHFTIGDQGKADVSPILPSIQWIDYSELIQIVRGF